MTQLTIPHYIAIEGPIGAGKTSLAKRLAQDFQGELVLESVEDNPFLEEFYKDRKKHALKTQILFLINRYQQQKNLMQHDLFHQTIVSDYLFSKDRLFAHMNLTQDELFIYNKVYSLMDTHVPKPSLVVYIQANLDILAKHIKKRGISYEKHIDMNYLEQLSEAYNRFFFTYQDTPLLTVNVTDLDFIQNQQDYETIRHEILTLAQKKGSRHFVGIGK